MQSEIFMGVHIEPVSEQSEAGKWIAKAILTDQGDVSLPVTLFGWPLEHESEMQANIVAVATAQRRIHRGQWRGQDAISNFQLLGDT